MEDYGSFKKLFGENTYYLTFLNLHTSETRQAFVILKEVVGKSRDIKPELMRLLDEGDWRPNLVAAVSLAFIKPTKPILAKVWERFDKGSWVCPQLAAVLSLYDKDFKQQSIKRLILGCLKRKTSPKALASPRTASDRAMICEPSCKEISSLVGLLTDSEDPEIQTLLQRRETKKMVADDVDHGGDIAVKWLTKYQRMIEDVR